MASIVIVALQAFACALVVAMFLFDQYLYRPPPFKLACQAGVSSWRVKLACQAGVDVHAPQARYHGDARCARRWGASRCGAG
jgi:hypothetical protein